MKFPTASPGHDRHQQSETGLACRHTILDISPLLQDAGSAIVDDSFLRCFQGASTDPWNWNLYLAPLWTLGLLMRYLVLFPLRWGLGAQAALLECVYMGPRDNLACDTAVHAAAWLLFSLGRIRVCDVADRHFPRGLSSPGQHCLRHKSNGHDDVLASRLVLLLGGFLVFFVCFYTIHLIFQVQASRPLLAWMFSHSLQIPTRPDQRHPGRCWNMEQHAGAPPQPASSGSQAAQPPLHSPTCMSCTCRHARRSIPSLQAILACMPEHWTAQPPLCQAACTSRTSGHATFSAPSLPPWPHATPQHWHQSCCAAQRRGTAAWVQGRAKHKPSEKKSGPTTAPRRSIRCGGSSWSAAWCSFSARSSWPPGRG